MKRIATILIALTLSVGAFAERSVSDIENVQVTDRTRHLANPDGVISAQTQWRIDTLLSGIRKRTSAEVSAVVVSGLGGADPDEFATELFQKWGIGKKDKDNGLLLLISIDDRAAITRTGYGMEGVLPDVLLRRLTVDSLYPRMRAGDYDRGTEALLRGIIKVLDNPDYAGELRSARPEYPGEEDDWGSVLTMLAVFSLSIFAISLCIYIYRRVTTTHIPAAERYGVAKEVTLISLCLTFFGLGLPVVVYLLARHWRDSLRNTPPLDSRGEKMERITYPAALSYLTPQQQTETRLGAMEYDVWGAKNTPEIKVLPFAGKNFKAYEVCENCGARAVEVIGTREKIAPTRYRHGVETTIRECHHCGNRTEKDSIIPREQPVPPIIPVGGRGFGGGGGFGGGSFGGGFGGGSTGGGGFSGRW